MPYYLTTLEGDDFAEAPEMFQARSRPNFQSRRQMAPRPAAIVDAVGATPSRRSGAMRYAAATPGQRWRPADGMSFRSRCVYVRNTPMGPGSPDSLDGWWTDLKKGASAVVRPIASVAADVGRTVAPILGKTAGTAIGAAFGTQGLGTQLGNFLPSGQGQFQQDQMVPTAQGPIIIAGQQIDPKLLYIGGGALLLVLLTRK